MYKGGLEADNPMRIAVLIILSSTILFVTSAVATDADYVPPCWRITQETANALPNMRIWSVDALAKEYYKRKVLAEATISKDMTSFGASIERRVIENITSLLACTNDPKAKWLLGYEFEHSLNVAFFNEIIEEALSAWVKPKPCATPDMDSLEVFERCTYACRGYCPQDHPHPKLADFMSWWHSVRDELKVHENWRQSLEVS